MSKINAAESIRGLACMAVVFSHLILSFFPLLHNNTTEGLREFNSIEGFIYHSPFAFWYSGSAAVYIFFVLSGFVLSYAILSKPDVNKKIASMLLKRFPRLAIPALFSCILAWIVLSFNVDMSNVSTWISYYGKESFNLVDALYQGTIGAFIFGSAPMNWVLWTMQIELFGSILLFFLLFFYNKNKYLFYILSVLLLIPTILVSFQFLAGMFCFIVGMYLYLYGKKIPTYLAVPSLLIGLYFAGVHNLSHSYTLFNELLGNKAYTILNILSGPLIVFGILMSSKISKIIDNRFFIYLGKLSFSIYLLHLMAIYIVGVPSFNFMLSSGVDNILSSLLACLMVIITTIITSHFYSKYIDDLSIRVSGKIEKFVFIKWGKISTLKKISHKSKHSS